MLDLGVIRQLEASSNMQQPSKTKPKYVNDMPPQRGGTVMSETGIYENIDSTSDIWKQLYLAFIMILILTMMCFRLWPLWLKRGVYLVSFYLLVFLIATAFVRLILWGILYHFGLEFWLFPNYFIDSNDPRDSFLPVYSFEVRDDAADWKSILLRLMSGALLAYTGYQFCQDEKNMEDLRDLAEHGLTDFFEYGQQFVVGNALGDGSQNNTWQDPRRTETFAEKYRKELKKDLSEFDDDDEYVDIDSLFETNATEGADEDDDFVNLDDLLDSMADDDDD